MGLEDITKSLLTWGAGEQSQSVVNAGALSLLDGYPADRGLRRQLRLWGKLLRQDLQH